MPITWVLISDAGRARLFAVNGKRQPWTHLQDLVHPGSRLKGQDIMADRAGRGLQSKGAHRRSGMAPNTDPKEVEAEHFAEELAKVLEDGQGRNAYTRLVLVAPPHFLGLLRQSLTEQVSKRVANSVDKDYSTLRADELAVRLADAV